MLHPIATEVKSADALLEDYKKSEKMGAVRFGVNNFYFKRFMKTYYIPYKDMEQCFRRVILVPAKVCCGRTDIQVQHLVVMKGGKELAQIQLYLDGLSAEHMMQRLQKRMPDANFEKIPYAGETAPQVGTFIYTNK